MRAVAHHRGARVQHRALRQRIVEADAIRIGVAVAVRDLAVVADAQQQRRTPDRHRRAQLHDVAVRIRALAVDRGRDVGAAAMTHVQRGHLHDAEIVRNRAERVCRSRPGRAAERGRRHRAELLLHGVDVDRQAAAHVVESHAVRIAERRRLPGRAVGAAAAIARSMKPAWRGDVRIELRTRRNAVRRSCSSHCPAPAPRPGRL